jgi:hypothetical protein
VHGSLNREHREREETKANSHRGIGRSGKGCTALAMTGDRRGSPELTKTVLEAMILKIESTGRERR